MQRAVWRLEQSAALDQPASTLKYSGGQRGQGLERLGLKTLRDLLMHYPSRYDDFSQALRIIDAPLGQRASILARVHSLRTKQPRPRLTLLEATLVDETGMFIATWFNQPWLATQLPVGSELLCLGKLEHVNGYRRMTNPLFVRVEDDARTGIQPVYRANAAVSVGWLRRFIKEALALCPAPLDPLPLGLRARQHLMPRAIAWREMHFPASSALAQAAHQRLAFEEVFYLELYLQQRRARQTAAAGQQRLVLGGPALTGLLPLLPFKLTDDQVAAVSDILLDLTAPKPGSRLLLGDVGSGKTVVALHALLAVADNGRQAAMMAPTEVLAEQYALTLGPYLDTLQVPWVLLTSSTSAAARQAVLQGLAAGSTLVAFGTHALLEPDVVFAGLALAVVDEQHRFGVAQRDRLRAKGQAVNYLALTATPIPRSLASVLYGDLDCTVIRSRPQAGTRRTTRLIGKGQLARAYAAVSAALQRGEQAYIVCPFIGLPAAGSGAAASATSSPAASATVAANANAAAADPITYEEESGQLLTEFSPEVDAQNIRAAEKEFAFLSRQVFAQRRVALLTSRLKSPEKQRIVEGFRRGQIDVLVSTTVIEVGIDVPNATVMIIQDADRFGLSQLHQLRGRVGRGHKDAEVFLVSSTKGAEAKQRLQSLVDCDDGFQLAEADLSLRREGDVTGLRQHGAGALQLVQVVRDAELIAQALAEAIQVIDADPELQRPEHALLNYELGLFYPPPADAAAPPAADPADPAPNPAAPG